MNTLVTERGTGSWIWMIFITVLIGHHHTGKVGEKLQIIKVFSLALMKYCQSGKVASRFNHLLTGRLVCAGWPQMRWITVKLRSIFGHFKFYIVIYRIQMRIWLTVLIIMTQELIPGSSMPMPVIPMLITLKWVLRIWNPKWCWTPLIPLLFIPCIQS